MSVVELSGAPARRRGARASERPALRPIAGERTGAISGLGFVAFVVFLLGAGMVGLLALNVQIQTTQLQLNTANNRAAALALQVSDRQAQVYEKAGPGQLAAAAGALGMVPNPNLAYIDLKTGKVIGDAQPVTGYEMPALRVRPQASVQTAVPTVSVRSSVQPWFNLADAATASQANKAVASTGTSSSPQP